MTENRYVIDLMTRNPTVVGPDMQAWRAFRVAEDAGVHDLLVLDAYRLIGIVCLCDLSSACASSTVSELMRRPITIGDQATDLEAMDAMDASNVGCLPVVDWSGMLLGVLTRRDLRESGLDGRRPSCATCGSTHGLELEGDDVVFCKHCLEPGCLPAELPRALFYTLGGGD